MVYKSNSEELSFAGEFNIREAQTVLADYQHFYHCVRPHYALELMIPMEYLQQCA